jgi:hypothetical protein
MANQGKLNYSAVLATPPHLLSYAVMAGLEVVYIPLQGLGAVGDRPARRHHALDYRRRDHPCPLAKDEPAGPLAVATAALAGAAAGADRDRERLSRFQLGILEGATSANVSPTKQQYQT